MRLQISSDFSINTDLLSLTLTEQAGRTAAQSRMAIENGRGKAEIYLSEGIKFSDYQVQEWLNKVIAETLRWFCPRLVTPRLLQFSQTYTLNYNRVTYKDVSSRWGSCSSKKNVNFSLWILLAPSHLVDYVLKHELSHLKHLDHSAAFWAEVDGMCGGPGTAKILDKAMNEFSKELSKKFLRRRR